MFQIPLEPRLIFKGGIPTFKNENENEAWTVKGYSPRKIAKCIRPIGCPTNKAVKPLLPLILLQ